MMMMMMMMMKKKLNLYLFLADLAVQTAEAI